VNIIPFYCFILLHVRDSFPLNPFLVLVTSAFIDELIECNDASKTSDYLFFFS